MHSILRNLAQKHSSPLNILEYSSILPKVSRYAIRPPLIAEHIKYSTISSEEYVTKINKHYSWLDIPKFKNVSGSLTKISYRTNKKFRRFFCQNTSKKSERDNKWKQLDKNDQLKRDEFYAEDCITAREEKCRKKHIKKGGDIKFTVNLNNIINEMNKKKSLEKQHEINKINNFIFKPRDCKSCTQKRRTSSKKCNDVNHQKRTKSSFSATKKNCHRYEKKQEKFQRQPYADAATYKPRIELLAFLNDNKYEKDTLLVKGKSNFTNLASKRTVPLFLLVKCNSTKSKTINIFTRNVKYKVGTNQALIKVYSKTKKSDKISRSLTNQPRFLNSHRDSNKQIANFDSVFNKTEKSKENKLQFYQCPTEWKSLAPNPVLAKAINEMLRPLIEQEYLQYKEVKEAIERLERNLQYHFNRSRIEGSECQVYKSLSNINHLRTRQSQLNLPDKKNSEVNDPKIDLEIIDPLDNNNRKGDPSTNSSISVPCIKKENIIDPIEFKITIIAKDCFDKSKKNGGCDGENGSKDKKEDSCKKEKKKEPCKQERDDDPCKKVEEKKKEYPCKEMKKKNSKCDENQRKDLCSKNIADLCKAKQKHDPCKDKKPPTPKKQPDPCNKKDSCKESSSTKDDDCFKKGSLKNKQKKSDLKDHSCMKPKKKVDNFVDSPTSCDGDKKAIRTDICKNADQSSKNNKVDPCKCFKERSKLTKDQCSKVCLKKEDPCKKLKEVAICKGTEPKKDKADCMKPSEVTCRKGNSVKPRPCCEQVCVCEEPKLPMIKPTCTEEPKKNCIKAMEKGPDHCKQVPMPMDCPMEINAEGKSQHNETVSCTQKSCSQKSMEPTEPPNCCKPMPESVGSKCSRTFEGQQIVKEKPEIRQLSCQELRQQQEKEAALAKAPPFPSPAKSSSPKSSESKEKKTRCPSPSKADTRYCTKPAKKEAEYVPEQAPPARIKPRLPCDEDILKKPYPECREPQQTAKDSWKPVKIIGKDSKPDCQLRHAKSAPSTKTESASDTSPKLSSDNTKEECSQKSFMDSCKGIFSSVYSMLCPGKNKKSGKKAASLGLIRSVSLPDIRGLTCGTLSGSSGNNYRKKKPGTMCFAHYKTKDRYPWRNTNRWIVRNERFFSKNHKKPDICETQNEEISPQANKLNCICYEEMKKSSHRHQKNQGGAEDECVKMGGEENKKEPTKRLNFKLTDHSKICQASNKTKANSKNEKSESHSRRDQSLFNQCGELSKQVRSGNVKVEFVQTGNSTGTSTNDARNTEGGQEQSCINKMKTIPEAEEKEESIERKQEQQKSCIDKLKISDGNMKRERSTEEEQKKACLDKLKSSVEAKQKGESTAGKQESAVDRQSKKKTSSKPSVRDKYPWQKSEEKMDGELCANQSAITTRSSEKNYASENVCSNGHIEGVEKENIMDEDKVSQDQKKKYRLEVEKDPSCFKGQIKNKSDIDKDKGIISNKMDKKQAPRSGERHAKENICAKNTQEMKKEQEKGDKFLKNKEEVNQGKQNEKKKYVLEIKKDPCCFKSQGKQSQSDVDKQKNQTKEEKNQHKEKKDQSKEDIKCSNSDGASKSKKQKYSLESPRDISCLKEQRSKTDPNDQANKEDKKNTKLSDSEKDCKNVENQKEMETANEKEKECSNYNKECKKGNFKNFLENYNKQVEKMLGSGENSSENSKRGKGNQEESQKMKTNNENCLAGKNAEDVCSQIRQKQSTDKKMKDGDGENECQKQITQKGGENVSENQEQRTVSGKENQECSKTTENKNAGRTAEDICSKITQKQSTGEKTKIEDNKHNCQKQVTQKGAEDASKNQEQRTAYGKGNQECNKTNENKHAGESSEDICSKITQKQSTGKKAKIEDSNNKCQKQDTQSSTLQKDSLNLNGFLWNENEEDMFICKVKKLGRSEQFLCNPKGKECYTVNTKEKGVVRVLKCKLTKDDRGRDVFICKEIKPNAAEYESNEDEELKMKRLLKQRSSPELPLKKMAVSKKLVCTQGTRDENNQVKKEIMCNIREVREIIEDKKIKNKSCDESNEKSPFTYKDLLKRSEKIRKKGNTVSLKRDKPEKGKECKDK